MLKDKKGGIEDKVSMTERIRGINSYVTLL